VPSNARGAGTSTSCRAGRGASATGATFRIIADTGDWDRSVGTNAPGQPGDPASPHYRDLFGLWAAGRYFPAFFSRDKVGSVTELTTRLGPPRAAR
jgi:penicillin amidase